MRRRSRGREGGRPEEQLVARRLNCWRVGFSRGRGVEVAAVELERCREGKRGRGDTVRRRPREGKVADARRQARGGGR